MKTITAIVVDPYMRQCRFAQIPLDRSGSSLDGLYERIDCTNVTIGYRWPDGSDLWLDDEAPLTDEPEKLAMFVVVDAHNRIVAGPFTGIGVILGGNDEGESISTRMTLDDVRIGWIRPEAVEQLAHAMIEQSGFVTVMIPEGRDAA